MFKIILMFLIVGPIGYTTTRYFDKSGSYAGFKRSYNSGTSSVRSTYYNSKNIYQGQEITPTTPIRKTK